MWVTGWAGRQKDCSESEKGVHTFRGALHIFIFLLFCQGPPSFPCSPHHPTEPTLSSFFRHVLPIHQTLFFLPLWPWPSPGIPQTSHLASLPLTSSIPDHTPELPQHLSVWPMAPLLPPPPPLSFPFFLIFFHGAGNQTQDLTHASFNCQLDNSQESLEKEPQCRICLDQVARGCISGGGGGGCLVN